MTGTAARPTVVTPTVEQARALVAQLLQDVGAPPAAAASVAGSLVTAERMGHASHGLVRVPEYRASISTGQIRPAETPVVLTRAGSTAVVDGRWGWGQLAAELAARTAADLARDTGAGFVTVRNCNHSGRLGEWVELIAARSSIGIGLLSCGPAVAPLGGLDRVLGTNPLAIAVPTPDRPVVLDFATAGLAEGKIRVAARAGKQVPAGVLQTADGEPSTDPGAFYAGGSILPFGAHKGYALSAVIQLLGEALTGGGRPGGSHTALSNGLVLVALSPTPGGPQFLDLVAECRARIVRSRPVDPSRPVLLPGDVEAAVVRSQPAGRLRVAAELWDELHQLLQHERGPR